MELGILLETEETTRTSGLHINGMCDTPDQFAIVSRHASDDKDYILSICDADIEGMSASRVERKSKLLDSSGKSTPNADGGCQMPLRVAPRIRSS